MRSVAVATVTRARNADESAFLLTSLEELSKLGIPLFIADAGSVPDFLQGLYGLPNVQLRLEGSNLVQQVKGSVRRAIAAGHQVILYTEPDKKEFFQRGALDCVAEALRSNADVCVAARDEQSFATFPGGQQRAETSFNQLASYFLEPLPDLLYGPLVLDVDAVAQYIEEAPDDLGWGWRTYLIARAARTQHKIVPFVGAFSCPVDQRQEDDEGARLYRLRQLSQNIDGLRLGLSDALLESDQTIQALVQGS